MAKPIEHSIQLVFQAPEAGESVRQLLDELPTQPLDALLRFTAQPYDGPVPAVDAVTMDTPEPELLLIHFITEVPPSSDLIAAISSGPWESYWIYRLRIGPLAIIHEYDSRDEAATQVYRYHTDQPNTWQAIPDSLISRFHGDTEPDSS